MMKKLILFLVLTVLMTVILRFVWLEYEKAALAPVLAKAAHAENALQFSGAFLEEKAQSAYEGIKRSCERNGNLAEDLEVLALARRVREKAAKTIDAIYQVREQIEEAGGYLPETGEIVNPWKTMPRRFYQGEAEQVGQMAKQLDAFAALLGEITGAPERFPSLATSGQQALPTSASRYSLSFEQRLFANTPAAIAMMLLAHLETEVAQQELQALEMLAKKISNVWTGITKTHLMVEPQSPIAKPGEMMTLTAHWFSHLTMTNGLIDFTKNISIKGISNPSLSYNSREGYLELSFKATAKPGEFDPQTGLIEKTVTISSSQDLFRKKNVASFDFYILP